ncbi:MAG: UDP-3-O-[3-hydroxymyristoyl] glucosamine N-acyltransferase [Candidatus Binatota bacterium]|jgi:UDP-3-O-[3-hydroxymyristoyl] glucosamine N-acyltransferase|nr:UDP-3-O-[3-hydroxymyristoyl] glucosamine N-acyltransferase [Candidatus Binatota bacterium]
MRLGEIAERIGCELEGDPAIEITGVSPIDDAGPGELTFVANQRYRSRLADVKAAAVIVAPGIPVPRGAALRSANPYLAFVKALDLFHRPHVPPPGIDPAASIAPDARLGARATVGPYAVIGEGARIGDDARIDAHVVVYPGVTIGHRFTAFAHVVVREGVTIGDDVKLQSGVVIGGDGFGYTPGDDGRIRAIPQTGTVILEDGVEIGSNTTIDRAAVGATRVRRGTKIDNLVMVAHGCDVGENVFVAAQVGLSGSARVGAGAQLGGQAGVAGHLTIGEGARVGAQAGVPNDVLAGATVLGTPAVDIRTFRRIAAAWLRLPALLRRLREVERKLGLDGDAESEE